MAPITRSKSAVEKLIEDRDVRHHRDGIINDRIPVLGYFHRSYATSLDGIVTECGDEFSSTTIVPADVKEAGIEFASVIVCDGFEILVGADASMMAADFTIGWSQRKFT